MSRGSVQSKKVSDPGFQTLWTMADNKHEAKKVRSHCLNRQKKTRETSGRSWPEGNKNKPNIKLAYSPPLNRQNRHHASSRADIILCKHMKIQDLDE